jgi:3-hydroxyisobutyrate dehydrogenase-like beta-hydroxyacid dehydrogenase
MKITFLGLGIMGSRMASNLLDFGAINGHLNKA